MTRLACQSTRAHQIRGISPAFHACCAVVKLHQVLRDSVGMMAIGVEVPRSDTVAEQGDAGPSAVPGGTGGKAAAKDLGDVRYAQICRGRTHALVLSGALCAVGTGRCGVPAWPAPLLWGTRAGCDGGCSSIEETWTQRSGCGCRCPQAAAAAIPDSHQSSSIMLPKRALAAACGLLSPLEAIPAWSAMEPNHSRTGSNRSGLPFIACWPDSAAVPAGAS